MTGGTVLMHGPTQNMDGALDDSGSFDISGGYLIAAGSAGMAMAPSISSSQNAVMINTTSALSAGTLIHIEDADGETIVTFRPTKSYQSFVLSSKELKTGQRTTSAREERRPATARTACTRAVPTRPARDWDSSRSRARTLSGVP